MTIRYLDGTRLQRSFLAGANAVNARRDHLNAINVFPVPDGDTGTNMASTLAYAADGIAHLDRPTIDEVRVALGRAVLVGAKGNSGFIMAQFLRGFMEGIGEGVRRMHADELSRACQEGVRRAYEATMEPVEGTILTVMREWSHAVANLSTELRDLSAILDGAMERARLALEHTQEQMALLRENRVVDAGAQGFVHMLEGINEFMHRGTVHAQRPEAIAIPPENASEAAERAGNLTFRYCTQILMEGDAIPVTALREELQDMGDSLIASGDAELFKVHIHTNDPDAVCAVMERYGSVLERKAEDMQVQAEAVAASRRRTVVVGQKQTVGIVLDSASDLEPDLAAESGIRVVPCQVFFGEDTYRDRVDLTTGRFYELLRTHPEHPKTSQPAPGDYRAVYESSLEQFDEILSVHITGKLSGTYQAAVQTAREVDEERITVVDSGQLSMSAGLIGLGLSRLAREGMPMNALLHHLEEMRRHCRLYCMLETLDFLVRGGRISKTRGWVGKTLGLLPILTVQDGLLEAVGKVRGSQKGLDHVFDLLEDEIPEGAPVMGVAAHAGNPEMAENVRERFTERFSPTRMYTAEIGPAIGSHTGPGAWGVFYLIDTPV